MFNKRDSLEDFLDDVSTKAKKHPFAGTSFTDKMLDYKSKVASHSNKLSWENDYLKDIYSDIDFNSEPHKKKIAYNHLKKSMKESYSLVRIINDLKQDPILKDRSFYKKNDINTEFLNNRLSEEYRNISIKSRIFRKKFSKRSSLESSPLDQEMYISAKKSAKFARDVPFMYHSAINLVDSINYINGKKTNYKLLRKRLNKEIGDNFSKSNCVFKHHIYRDGIYYSHNLLDKGKSITSHPLVENFNLTPFELGELYLDTAKIEMNDEKLCRKYNLDPTRYNSLRDLYAAESIFSYTLDNPIDELERKKSQSRLRFVDKLKDFQNISKYNI